MEYTIRAIEGELVTIDFSNGQWAQIAIPSDLSQDQINRLVGQFCSEYKVQAIANPLLNVGDTHTTSDPNESLPVEGQEEQSPQIDDRFTMDLGSAASYIDMLSLVYVAQELDTNGDSTVLDILKARAADIIANPEFSITKLVSQLNDTL